MLPLTCHGKSWPFLESPPLPPPVTGKVSSPRLPYRGQGKNTVAAILH